VILHAFVVLLAAVLIPRLPDAIPARELRTHADTTWLVGAAAQALPYHSILSAGANSFPGTSDPADTDRAGDRARLAIVAWALEVPFDSAEVKAPPPVCPSDSAAPRLNGYRMEHVRIVKGDSMVGDRAGAGAFHYIVKFTRACWTQGKAFQLTSDVRFDAARDTGASHVWRVGWVRNDPDPVRPPRTTPLSFGNRHPQIAGYSLVFFFLGPLAFPVFAFVVASNGGRRALAILLGSWAFAGVVFGALALGSVLGPALLMFLAPAITYVAAAEPESGSSRLRFGRATAACLGVYVGCLVIGFLWLLSALGSH